MGTVMDTIQILFDELVRQNRRRAAVTLSSAVEEVYNRIRDASGAESEMISFDNFCKSNAVNTFLHNCFPLTAYKKWTRHVKQRLKKIEKKKSMKNVETTMNPGDGNTANEKTALLATRGSV